jgi:hypothetical protein
VVVALRDSDGRSLTSGVLVELFNFSSSRSFANNTAILTARFDGLSPGQYTLKISGPTVRDYSKVENVQAGLTTPETVYLTLIPAPPEYGGIIFFGSLGVGVGLLGVLMVLKARRTRIEKNKKSSLLKKAVSA